MSRKLIAGSANKAAWPAAVNAALLLINGRLPEGMSLDQGELGLLMIIVGCLVAYWIPNRPEADREDGKEAGSPDDSSWRPSDQQRLQSV